MSSNSFCPSCGAQNSYINGMKPNFCQSCGFNLKDNSVFGATRSDNRMGITVHDDDGPRFRGNSNSLKKSVKVVGLDNTHLDKSNGGTAVRNIGIKGEQLMFAHKTGLEPRNVKAGRKRTKSDRDNILKSYQQECRNIGNNDIE